MTLDAAIFSAIHHGKYVDRKGRIRNTEKKQSVFVTDDLSNLLDTISNDDNEAIYSTIKEKTKEIIENAPSKYTKNYRVVYIAPLNRNQHEYLKDMAVEEYFCGARELKEECAEIIEDDYFDYLEDIGEKNNIENFFLVHYRPKDVRWGIFSIKDNDYDEDYEKKDYNETPHQQNPTPAVLQYTTTPWKDISFRSLIEELYVAPMKDAKSANNKEELHLRQEKFTGFFSGDNNIEKLLRSNASDIGIVIERLWNHDDAATENLLSVYMDMLNALHTQEYERINELKDKIELETLHILKRPDEPGKRKI